MAVACTVCGTVNPDDGVDCTGCHCPLADTAPTEPRCRAHLRVKAAGTCARCGAFACQACLERGLCADCLGKLGPLAWDQRATLGTLRAWWRTSLQMLRAPRDTLARAWPQAPLSSSLGLAWLSSLAGVASMSLMTVVPALVKDARSSDHSAFQAGRLTGSVVGSTVGLLALACAPVAAMLLVALLDHLVLRVMGARPRPFPVTVRAGALSLAPLALGAVPLCSVCPGLPWALVLRAVALRSLQRASWPQALVAVLPSCLLSLWSLAGLWGPLAEGFRRGLHQA